MLEFLSRQSLADWGTIVALVALIHAVRNNTQEVRRSSYHEMVGASSNLLKALYLNEGGLLDLWRRVNGQENVDPRDHDTQRWYFFMMAAFRHFDNLVYQKNMKALDKRMWPSYRTSIVRYMKLPGFDSWFSENDWAFSDALKAEVQSIRIELAAGEHGTVGIPNRAAEAERSVSTRAQ